MWRKQEEPKAPSSSREVGTSTVVTQQAEPPASVVSAAPPAAAAPPATPAAASAAPSATARPASAAAGFLSRTLVVKGEITGREDLFIDGEVQGKIRIDEGTVTIGSNGRVNADVVAREIVVLGHVKGNLNGRERVQIGQTGHATGNVLTRRISVDDGAEIHGHVEIAPVEPTESLVRSPRVKSAAAAVEAAAPVAAPKPQESPAVS